MNKFPFISHSKAINIFRIITSCILVAHGIIRIYAGTVNGFGGFLSEKGFPFGSFLAWFITIFEILGGLLLAAGYFRKIISSIFILQLIMGIILVHAANGWFVVGYQSGGVEYSVLLIFSFLLIASSEDHV